MCECGSGFFLSRLQMRTQPNHCLHVSPRIPGREPSWTSREITTHRNCKALICVIGAMALVVTCEAPGDIWRICIKIMVYGGLGEPQRLRDSSVAKRFAVLAEDLGFVLSTHVTFHDPWNSSSRESMTLFWSLQVLQARAVRHAKEITFKKFIFSRLSPRT